MIKLRISLLMLPSSSLTYSRFKKLKRKVLVFTGQQKGLNTTTFLDMR
jgi:hypothetical protein